MKKVFLITGILFCFILMSCTGNDKPNPEETANAFINLWLEQDFDAMHKLLTDEAKELYPKKAFTARNAKIYNDLNISNLNISADSFTNEEIKTAKKENEMTLNIKITFDTIAGEIHFNRNMVLLFDEAEEERSWHIDWDEGFILPGLEDGGKVAIETLEPRRGEILDRNKMPLALNDVAYEIGVTPESFQDEESEKQSIATLLNMSVDKIDEHLQASWVQADYFVPLSIIPATASNKLDELQQIPSVSYRETSGRTYPLGAAAAHLTGYIGKITQEELKEQPKGKYSESDFIGKNGLEKMYEDQLHGEEGVKVSIVSENETGEEEEELVAEKPVKNGEHLELSIDVNVQEKIYNAYEGRAGTSAAIHPKTGEVLALVSSPAYNPDELTYGISQSRWDELNNDPNKPFVNRFSATYAPGSVIKPITAAVGIANDTINFEEGLTINGLTWSKKNWGNEKVTRVSTSQNPVNLEDALKSSDNIYFAMKAVDMGSEEFIKGMKTFGFGEKLPLEFPITNSEISNSGKLDEILLANTSYGQGEIEMSSLHVALAYTTFLNDGTMLKPSFLLKDDNRVIWKENIINKKEAEKMKTFLRKVVTEGTAKIANDEDLHISGKTGTAELKLTKDGTGHQNGWFVGYPTDKEDILIAMMMESVEGVGTSSYVAEKVKNILKDVEK